MKIILTSSILFMLIITPYSADSTIVDLSGVVDLNRITTLVYVVNHSGFYTPWSKFWRVENAIHLFNVNSTKDTIIYFDIYTWNHGPSEFLYTDFEINCYDEINYYISGDVNGIGLTSEAFLETNKNSSYFRIDRDSLPFAGFLSITNVEITHTYPPTVYATVIASPILGDVDPDILSGYIKSTDGGHTWEPYSRIDYQFQAIYQCVPFYLLALNPKNEKIMLGLDTTGYLIKTWDAGLTSQIVDTNKIWDSVNVDFYYDRNPRHIYALSNKGNTYQFLHSADSSNSNSWELIASSNNEINVTIDTSNSGEVYYSLENSIYVSYDYAKSFAEYFDLKQNITGLYKKPNSNILYFSTAYRIFAFDGLELSVLINFSDTTTVLVNEYGMYTEVFALSQNYPNPFNPSTTITFSIHNSQFTILKVYDILGSEIATLVNETRPPGTYEVEFDGSLLPSGVYFYQLNAGNFLFTKKMVMMK